MFAIAFPQIDPVIFAIGPVALRWYGLAYVVAIFTGAWYMKRLVQRPPSLMTPAQVDDFMLWALVGVVLGGRIGYALIYKPMAYLSDPLAILRAWEGGMSFHGGLLGTILAIMLFARRHKLDQWYIADGVGVVTPIGLFLGRLANFINGELWGRVAPDVPWAMVFPDAGDLPRHPSQLYQASLEGVLLLIIMLTLARNETIRRRPGTLTGAFLIGYGCFRLVGEVFREPDAHIGFLAMGTTMGQLLSVPMVLFGVYCIVRAKSAAKA